MSRKVNAFHFVSNKPRLFRLSSSTYKFSAGLKNITTLLLGKSLISQAGGTGNGIVACSSVPKHNAAAKMHVFNYPRASPALVFKLNSSL